MPLVNKQVVDLNGESIGEVEAVYYRSLTGDPEWLAVSTGLVDAERVLVPLDGATVAEEAIRLAQAKESSRTRPRSRNKCSQKRPSCGWPATTVFAARCGVESERDDENVRLRAWQPARTAEPS